MPVRIHKLTVLKWLFLLSADSIIVAAVLLLASLVGTPPPLYALAIGGCIWVAVSLLSNKLNFTRLSRTRYCLLVIVIINIFLLAGFYLLFLLLGRHLHYGWDIIVAAIGITLLEMGLCVVVRSIFFTDIPLSDEDAIAQYHSYAREIPSDASSRELLPELELFKRLLLDDPIVNEADWCRRHAEALGPDTLMLSVAEQEPLLLIPRNDYSLIVNVSLLNGIRHINKFLFLLNRILPMGACIISCCTTSEVRKASILKNYPPFINRIVYAFDYLWHRVFPKLMILQKIYYFFTRGHRRVLPRAEVLGRLYCCGFAVKQEFSVGRRYYICAVKTNEADEKNTTNSGVFIRLKRVGKDGKIIGVYKFRTMHAYAEYLQPYIYRQNRLDEKSKIANDYRITTVGRFLRRSFVDELPMIINLLRGEMKLVGVRPLSEHYFSLYSPRMQALRIKTKPGLLPPYYAYCPKPMSLEVIQADEERYLRAWFEHPGRTDWHYFWRILYNIIIKRERSS